MQGPVLAQVSSAHLVLASDHRVVALKKYESDLKRLSRRQRHITRPPPTRADIWFEALWSQVAKYWRGVLPVPPETGMLAAGETEAIALRLDKDLAGRSDLMVLPYEIEGWISVLEANGIPSQ